MIEFAESWVLWLLPLPLLVRWILPEHREARDAVVAPFAPELAELSGQELTKGSVAIRRTAVQAILFAIVWGLALTATARPQWIGDPIVRSVPTRDLLLAVDLSGSMATEDFLDRDGNRVDRLTAVKQVLADFLEKREGDRVGLLFFGSAAFVQAPFTDDLTVVGQLLEEAQVRMAGPRTVVGDAIGLAINTFESSELEDRVMILLTDGNDTGSRVPPERAAVIAKDRDIVIHTVAVGDPTAVGEAELDERALSEVAATTGGLYAHAANRDELAAVYEELDALETRQVETQSYRPRSDLFHWPLAALLALTTLYHAFVGIPAWLRLRGTRLANG